MVADESCFVVVMIGMSLKYLGDTGFGVGQNDVVWVLTTVSPHR